MIKHPITIASILMGLFAAAGTGLVAFTHQQTAGQIAANEREALVRKLHALVPADSIDNDMASDRIIVNDLKMLGSESVEVYRGRHQDTPVAVVIATIVPNGYSGPIKLLIAVRYDGSLGGIRVISHKETPGLGDKIEEERSDWIFGFEGKSLTNPPIEQWKVKRDGGFFDQFTGATVTPRSIVTMVKNTLIYATQQRDRLYFPLPTEDVTTKKGKPSGDSDG